jgi:hypothetical protein
LFGRAEEWILCPLMVGGHRCGKSVCPRDAAHSEVDLDGMQGICRSLIAACEALTFGGLLWGYCCG